MKILQRILPLLALLWAATSGAATTTSVPTVAIATTPLFGKTQNVHPNLLLALSVEFPTTGAAYRGAYSAGTEYVGYFNNTKCYTYDAANGYFTIAGNASATHTCSGQFSGNFMNWAASSAIDMLRLAMTGGDRVVDTRTQTVLQRAVLQGSFFKSGSYFPLKTLSSKDNGVAPNQVTPYNYATLYMASCGNHIFFSDADGSSSCGSLGPYADKMKNNVVSERRGYRVQVQVCDGSEAATRTDLCYSYDGTNYKPVGQMQRNAERVRFAAFGYLNDNYNNGSPQSERYGGVLRAPMKYLGDTAVDTSLKTIPNNAKEWDAYGVLLPNPLGETSSNNSGVINYLNKFGRTTITDLGGPTNNPVGSYKTYDPLSELYYEAIRYLQFHKDGPTPEAVNNLTTANTDNFTVYTKWAADPMINKCQRNYVMTIGDINTHQDHYIPGNTVTGQGDPTRPKDAYSGFDVVDWTNRVGAMEANSPNVGNASPNASLAGIGTRNHPTSSNSTYYMAGVAYWAHTYAFRPDMPDARVTTFGIDVNENGNGTVGPTQRQSQIYLAAKYGGFLNATKDGGNNDGNPFQTLENGKLVNSGKEWESAPGSNIPSTWFLASQPKDMINAIRKIFDVVANSGGTLAGIALSSQQVYTDQTIYTPGFDSQWNGKLTATPLIRNADGTVSTSSAVQWEVGAKLGTRTPDSRSIFTFSQGGTPFLWANLSKEQQAQLNTNPDTSATDSLGSRRLDYLRGDRSQEANGSGSGGVFRPRQTRLGDIINSAPVYVGAPAPSQAGTGYGDFLAKYASRTPMVYVGANDGMLHGFNATTGDEVFAYVPNAVFGALNQLTSQTYSHRAYVDATPTISEALVGSHWKSVLASGFGGGAQGVFALDLTDPSGSTGGTKFGTSSVIWEFTDKDDSDMGNVMGKPVIVKLMSDKDDKGVPVYKWFVVVGNGINSNVVDGTKANPNTYNDQAPAALFILSLDKAAGDAWQLGVNYWKIVTPAPTATPPYTTANGLSTPALVGGGNGTAVAAYAGDLQGNLWKFNLSGVSTTWNANANGALPPYGGFPGKPMFVATDKTTGARQPITIQPQVVFAPGGYMVLFGTGKYYEISDTDSNPASGNSFYGIYDGNGTQFAGGRANLNELKLAYMGDMSGITYDGIATPPGFTGSRKPGWVMDFKDKTERQITSAAVRNGLVAFNSIFTAMDGCNTDGGSRQYVLNALTGMPTTQVTGLLSKNGLLGAPTIITVAVKTGARGSVGGVTQNIRTQIISLGTDGAMTVSPPVNTTDRGGRLGWREVRNFTMN